MLFFHKTQFSEIHFKFSEYSKINFIVYPSIKRLTQSNTRVESFGNCRPLLDSVCSLLAVAFSLSLGEPCICPQKTEF